MEENTINWPYIRCSLPDYDMIRKIQSKENGLLKGAESRAIMMIAATLAVRFALPPLMQKEEKKHDIMNSATLNGPSASDYRQMMLTIYYATHKDVELDTLKDTNEVVANFIDYAHRGLAHLYDIYMKPDGDKVIDKMLMEQLENATNSDAVKEVQLAPEADAETE